MKNKQKRLRNFGAYLYSVRIRQNEPDLADFLRRRHLEISQTYYRDLETGRKLPQLGTAAQLCKDLGLEQSEFFYHLLKDILPETVFDELIKPTSRTVFGEASEEVNRLSSMLEVYRKAHWKAVSADPYEVDEAVVGFLEEKFEFLPLIHFIYMRRDCSFSEVEEVLRRNGKKLSLDEALSGLEKNRLAGVDRQRQRVQRYKRTFRIPRTEAGSRFKDRFLTEEVKASLGTPRSQEVLDRNGSFVFSGITCFDPEKARNIKDRVTDLLTAFDGDETDLEEPGAVPFFLALIASPRCAYSSQKSESGVISKTTTTEKL